ncbi:transcription initiation factor TFIID subunit A-domain-containing protein [Lasiosphaeria ovina]|uniref:Transcription initiation factor TFIID subunit A-domain-containing protein n=1 Tax=Lasiosphaeria ovina TaxID=92902 RepID=A0AAE0NB38_9PEZI|nr:transcription initiation factor TFIID subunit A-domain-containing protein [Lasiosphaeria ovina]
MLQQQELQQPGQGAQTALQQPQQSPVAPHAVPGGSGNGLHANAQTPAANRLQPPKAAVGGPFPQQLSASILSHVNELVFQPPPNVTEKEKWIEDMKTRYVRALQQIEITRSQIQALGDPATLKNLSPDEVKLRQEEKTAITKQHNVAITFVKNVRASCLSSASQKALASAGNAAPNSMTANASRPQGQHSASVGVGAGTRQQPGPGVSGAPVPTASGGPMQNPTAAVTAAIEAAKKQQLAAGRMPGANGVPGPQQGPPPHQVQQAQPQTQTQAPATAPQVQAPPTPVTQQAAPPQPAIASQPPTQQPPSAPIKIEPGTQQPPHIPAPLNTALAASGAVGMQSSGTPTQNSARIQTPQSATPTGANIRPLTHAAAINLAAQQRAGSLSGPVGGAQSGTPSSVQGGVIGTAQQGHPHAHPPQQQPLGQANLTSKLPIPKVLPEKATQLPTPVPIMGGIGTSRPSYSGGGGIGGGVMNQPALAKTPAYQLEGEGERVLNKKKLDELVRQVCGGTAEGQEGNLLTPEVEESVLNLADAFVDSVLHSACRNAKERGSKVLEIRDIQLVLERTYNIRIPGYSSEELRTVRKVQPNAQWISKMSAVQAAKVMPGKGDL